MATSDYEIPPFGTTGDRLLGWLLEAVSEGDSWLSTQRPAIEWEKVLDLLGPSNPSDDVKGISNTGYNRVERNARDIVSSLSNFRHDGEYKPRFDTKLYEQAHVLTKLDRNWYTETHAHTQYRSNIQNAVVFGTGYLYEDWDKEYWGTHGDIRLQAIGPQDVTFLQLPRDHDIQKAYAVIIRDEMPLNLAKATYENIASNLSADRDKPGWLLKGLQALQRIMGGSPLLRVAGQSRQNQTGSFPTVDIFHMYIVDRSINRAPTAITMGAPGTNWSYTVPALGDMLPTGIINPATGSEFTRPAEEADCRLFPLRRYAVFSRTAVSSDNSSPWWHGAVPLARTRFNDWAWNALGKSLLSDTRTMQDGVIALMRYIEDTAACSLDPPTLVDDQVAGEGFSKTFRLRKAGAKAYVSLQLGDIMKPALTPEYYKIQPQIFEWLKQQEGRIDHQMGTPDLVAIAKAKQVPGEGTLEKILEMAGPLVQDMMRSCEVPLHELGEWRKALYFQFYTRARIIQTVGDDEKAEDFEYTPDLLVQPIPGESIQSRQERTRLYLHQFKYHLTESGVNEMHRLVNRLAMLQLIKVGVPIDWWTIAKAWRIPNFGEEPEGTRTVMQRWIAQQHLVRELAEEMGGGQPGKGAGRPPTNQRPPQLVGKDGGSRQTVKTS